MQRGSERSLWIVVGAALVASEYSPAHRAPETERGAVSSLHFIHYDVARIHQTLRITPARAAGVTDHAWETGELLALLGE